MARQGTLTPSSLVRVQLPLPKNSTSFDLSIFLFKPQAWYGITRQRVWYRRRRMESPKVHFLRLDSIPSCNGFHTMLCIDSIHASRRDVAHEFKSIRKLLKISFLSPIHKKRQSSTEACRFYFFTLHSSLKPLVDFWQVIVCSEKASDERGCLKRSKICI